jgi:magnesium-transporting ATPase (P-type)
MLSFSTGIYVVSAILHPLVPTVLVVAVGIASQRLHANRISSIQADNILVAGTVDMVFFDKTGTLTTQGMDLVQVVAGEDYTQNKICQVGLAVCHKLTVTRGGSVVGTQVDLAAFRSTGAALCFDNRGAIAVTFEGELYTLIQRFHFDNERKTQSVVVEDKDGRRFVFVKGSPEAIASSCLHYTIPNNFRASMSAAERSAFYQLAIGFKSLRPDCDVSEANRDDIERGLFFGGFLNLENALRKETPAVLDALKVSEIPCAMITGDNVNTGVTIARQCNMILPNKTVLVARRNASKIVQWFDIDNENIVDIEPLLADGSVNVDIALAVTGDAWNRLCKKDPSLTGRIANHIKVFGRCKPSDKAAIISYFNGRGKVTLMCGDGQNDCGGLKTAHVGVALSNSEASMVAPFTSLDMSLSAVTEVICVGRGTLASALAAYSHFIAYGQLAALLIILSAYLGVWYANNAWTFSDCIYSTTMGFSLPLAKAAVRLTTRRPTGSLISLATVVTICGMMTINFIFITTAVSMLHHQEWYPCRNHWGQDTYDSGVIVVIAHFQVIANAFVLNFGYDFRERWYKNRTLVAFACAWFLLIILITVYPSKLSCLFRVNCANEVS